MTQEDKELLLKDLCARLPYEVEIQVNGWTLLDTVLKTGHIAQLLNNDIKLKPYLRPMSSMTEEEYKVYHELVGGMFGTGILINLPILEDLLNAHHLDYRGLIEKGLALEAPEGMYN